MEMKYKVTGLVGAIAIISLVLIASSTENIGSASCQYFNMPLFHLSGYSCTEQSGTIRSFFNPGAYEQMVSFYVPPLEQTTPDYTFVTGGQTEGLSR